MNSDQNPKHRSLKHLPELVGEIKKDPGIVSLYLFGSHAKGKTWAKSDIDLAVLLDNGFPAQKQFKKRLSLLALASGILKTDDLDLIIMNQSPPFLNYNIFKGGQLLYENNEAGKAQRVAFQAHTYNAYFDFQPVAGMLRNAMIERIKEGRFGG